MKALNHENIPRNEKIPGRTGSPKSDYAPKDTGSLRSNNTPGETNPLRDRMLLFERLRKAALTTRRLMPATQSSTKDGVVLPSPSQDFRRLEVLTLLSNSGVSRAVRIATVASLDNIDLLIDIAIGDSPTFLKKDSLLRIDELCNGSSLDKNRLDRLVGCLNNKELVAFTVTLMDMSDYDWCIHCDEKTVSALCLALHECTCIHETVLLEDALAHLSHTRSDLGRVISASSTERFFIRAA